MVPSGTPLLGFPTVHPTTKIAAMNTPAMPQEVAPLSLRQLALLAGGALLLMAAAAGFSYGYVHGSLIVTDDPVATFDKLAKAEGLFRLGILGWLLILVLDVGVAWALYLYMRPVQAGPALLMGWLRLAYAAVLGVAIMPLLTAAQLLGLHSTLAPEVLGQQVMTQLATFESTWSLGLIVFGLHLLVLGYLALRARHIHQAFGWLLLLAGLGYVFVHVAKLLSPGEAAWLATTEQVLSVPMALGELAFAVWLLIRGGR